MAAATMYVTVSGAGLKDGSDWDNAFGLAEFETDFESSVEPGDVYYIYSGDYTFTDNILTAIDGTATNPIMVIGISDQDLMTEAQGDDRPNFIMGAYAFVGDNYIGVKNIRSSSTASQSFHFDTTSAVINCKVENTSGLANRYAILCDGKILGCESKSTNGYAFGSAGSGFVVRGCEAYDSAVAVKVLNHGGAIIKIISDSCTTGVAVGAYTNTHIEESTFYDGTTAISGSGCCTTIIDNHIVDFTTGVSWTSAVGAVFLDYNNFYNCTTDVSNVAKGANSTDYDPDFVDAANGNFALGAAAAGRGSYGVFPRGLSTGYREQGAVQSQTSVAYTAPTFAGITGLEDVGGGMLKASWAAATGTVTSYDVYVKNTNDTDLFTSANLKAQLPNDTTSFKFRVQADNDTLLTSTDEWFVGVRATNTGNSDTNTASLSSTISGDGTVHVTINDRKLCVSVD